jgi:hypothetical protein
MCVLDHEPEKDVHESAGESLKRNELQHALDLRRADLDPELFAAAVAVQYIRRLIVAGGGRGEEPDKEALHPHHLEEFLARTVEMAHTTSRFEQEWRQLHRMVPQIQAAWERGQGLFQEDLTRAAANPEEIECLSMIDFAESCYATVDARKAYPHERVLQAWTISGYMLAWWKHFSASEDVSV